MRVIKKITALLLAAGLLLALVACGSSADTSVETIAATTIDDATYILTQPEGDAPLDGGGTAIAYACDASGISTGANMAVWRGVQAFANSFHYQATASVAKENSVEAAVAALRDASESGAPLVVCNGDTMAKAVYQLQNNYPTVSYLLLDGEPHSEDYASYTTASNVHCALFAEEQAGYLAGYAAVQEGNMALGFLGSDQLPGIVRYCTGFLQGAEAAAEEEGVAVTLRTWYCATESASAEITAVVEDWYHESVDLILVSGGNLLESCMAAADATGGRIIATDWDQTALHGRIRCSAIKCYNRVTQQQLYSFFMGGGSWDNLSAGQSTTMGFTEDAVALTTADWRVRNFTVQDYTDFYEDMKENALRVGRYSDMTTLPDTPNVTVQQSN